MNIHVQEWGFALLFSQISSLIWFDELLHEQLYQYKGGTSGRMEKHSSMSTLAVLPKGSLLPQDEANELSILL